MIPWPDFAAVPTAVIRADLSPLALRLMLALAKHANQARIAWPKHKALLALLPEGTSESALIRAKRELERKGFLTSERGAGKGGTPGHRSSRYRLMMPDECDLTISSGDDSVRSDLTIGSGLSARNGQVEKELTKELTAVELPAPDDGAATKPINAVGSYCDLFKARYGQHPVCDGQDAGKLNNLLRTYGSARYQLLLDRYFQADVPGHPVDFIRARANALLLGQPAGHGRPTRKTAENVPNIRRALERRASMESPHE